MAKGFKVIPNETPKKEDLVFHQAIIIQVHHYMYHIDKCHINPASGGVFCYNIGIEKKNFAHEKSTQSRTRNHCI